MIDEWADYMQVNEECDETCANKCFIFNKSDKQFFDEHCLDRCDCHFKTFTQDEFREKFVRLGEMLDEFKNVVFEKVSAEAPSKWGEFRNNILAK